MVRELVIISGKGGTGKTSLATSFAALAGRVVLADCDVDAANLHLILAPQVLSRQEFSGGRKARIQAERCAACGRCAESCRFDAVRFDGPGNDVVAKTYTIDPIACEGCGVCRIVCPAGAIAFEPVVNGEWFDSQTRLGRLVHARLGVAEENCGKLVALIRRQARQVAEAEGIELIIVDGSPGIGCPVIASITGADLALVVTEPTTAALHDLERVCQLTRHFEIKTLACINKADLNPQMTSRIAERCGSLGVELAGTIRYDRVVTDAQIGGRSIVEYGDGALVEQIKAVWSRVLGRLYGEEQADVCGDERNRKVKTIAIPVSGESVSPHFGRCEAFVLVQADPQARRIVSTDRIPAPPHEPGLLPRWLQERGVQVVLAGGMGPRAQQLFAEQGIEVVLGAPGGPFREVVQSYLEGNLQPGPNVCDH